jgi:hypothetical protein
MLNKTMDFFIKVIFGVLFLIIITPVGIFIRMFGIDFLERKINLKASSYWKKHSIFVKSDN